MHSCTDDIPVTHQFNCNPSLLQEGNFIEALILVDTLNRVGSTPEAQQVGRHVFLVPCACKTL